jgi:tetratricopeptide (TPR) repeat protein
MNKFELTKLIIILTLIPILAGCAGKSGQSFSTEYDNYQLRDEPILSQRQRADLYEAIIAGDMARHNEDYITAMSYYLFAAELSRNQQLIDKSIEMANAADDSLGLEQALYLWLEVSPENQQARIALLTAQLSQQKAPDALETLIVLLKSIESQQQQFELLDTELLNHEPRTVNFILQSLLANAESTNDQSKIVLITAQAKFYMKVAVSNKQSPSLLLQALERVEDALIINPLFNPAIRLKTHILFQARKDQQAKIYLLELFEQHPESIAINQMLGQLLYDMADYQSALLHYQQWLKQHPQDLEARNYLAASYYALGQYEISLKHFKNLLEQGYHSNTTAFYCGDSASKLKNLEQAIICFEMVDDGRFLTLSKIKLAKLLVLKENKELALSVLRTPYDVNQKSQIQLAIAEIDLLQDHFSAEQAKQKLTDSLTLFPDNLTLLLKKIEIYQLIKQPDLLMDLLVQARQQLQTGAKLDRFNLAVAALLRNNKYYQQAVNWLDDAVNQKPNDKELLYVRALYKEPLGLYPEMINEFKNLLKLYPDDLNIKNALGYTLADMNQELDYAQSLIDTAYQGMPNNVAVIDSKGWLAFRLGKLDAAEEYLDRAFKLSPSPEGAAHLGEVLWKKSFSDATYKEKAKQIWQQGMQLDKENFILLNTLERLKIEL